MGGRKSNQADLMTEVHDIADADFDMSSASMDFDPEQDDMITLRMAGFDEWDI